MSRPLKFGERLVKREMRLPESLNERLTQAARLRGQDVSDVMRRAVEREVSSEDADLPSLKGALKDGLVEALRELGVVPASALGLAQATPIDPLRGARRVQVLDSSPDSPSDTVTLRRLPGVPCGPWKEAVDEAVLYPVPREVAGFLGALEGDLLVPCEGQSMREAGIPDGGVVVMRLLDGAVPAPGAIILCCVERAGGEWLSTIKYFYGMTAYGKADLRDGKLRPYSLPEDAREVHLVAVLVGVMGRATQGSNSIKGHRATRRSRGLNAPDEAERALAE